MALDRLPIDEPLAAYLDGLARVPPDLEGLYGEMEGDASAPMMTHPDLGALLEALVRATGGWAVLEIGTFVGTSAAWMARALAPGGRIDTLEADPGGPSGPRRSSPGRGSGTGCASTAGRRWRPSRGCPTAPTTSATSTPTRRVTRTISSRPCGSCARAGLILADNVLSGGRVALPAGERGESADALATFTRAALDHPRLVTTVLTIGDGVSLSAVIED